MEIGVLGIDERIVSKPEQKVLQTLRSRVTETEEIIENRIILGISIETAIILTNQVAIMRAIYFLRHLQEI